MHSQSEGREGDCDKGQDDTLDLFSGRAETHNKHSVRSLSLGAGKPVGRRKEHEREKVWENSRGM